MTLRRSFQCLTSQFIWVQPLLLLVLLLNFTMSAADPVVVDDRNSTVVYNGNWTVQTDRDGLHDGGDTWSETPGATVSFTFIGSVSVLSRVFLSLKQG